MKKYTKNERNWNIIAKCKVLINDLKKYKTKYEYAELKNETNNIIVDINCYNNEFSPRKKVILKNNNFGMTNSNKYKKIKIKDLNILIKNIEDFLKTFIYITAMENDYNDIIILDYNDYMIYNNEDDIYLKYSGADIRELIEKNEK